MMKETTLKNIELLKEKVGNEMFTEADTKGFVSMTTLRKYDLITSTTKYDWTELESPREVMNVANRAMFCAGYENEEAQEEYRNSFIEYKDDKWYLVKYTCGYKFK